MVYVFLADGFEEVEAIAPVDILRRGGVEVQTVGISKKAVTGSHSIVINADLEESEVDFNNIDAVILPGGMPGTLNLEANDTVQKSLEAAFDNGKLIGAICAAPSILGHKGYLNGKRATCYPGFEDTFTGGEYTADLVTECGNIITGKGPGAALDFGFALLKYIKDEQTANEVKSSMQCKD